MSKFLAGIAALTLAGAAAMPIQASATDREAGVSPISKVQSTDLSSHRRYWRHRYGYYRHYWGPRYRYGYYGYPYRHYGYRYGYYGYPRYGYYRPGISFGIGPFGFGVF